MTIPEWNNSTVIRDNVTEEIAKLREQPGGDILVNGSVQLVQTLIEADLVDEIRLMVFPVVLGSGKRLFDETSKAIPFDSLRVLLLLYSHELGVGEISFFFLPGREAAPPAPDPRPP